MRVSLWLRRLVARMINDMWVETAARAMCNTLGHTPGAWIYTGDRPPEGHRFNYPSCMGPNCSCWVARKRLARVALGGAISKRESE